MTESDTHSIRRLRFRGQLDNPRLARRRVEVALSDGAEASRLGKEAILCVRRIAIPLQRVEKLKEALEAETFAAPRPARGPVPANANAVLFADRAELLACLARDWCAGNTGTLWWWPVLFPGDDFGAVVRRAWLEDARPLPAALARLEAAGLASQFLAKFPPVETAALWRNIVNTFQLEAFEAAWSATDNPRMNSAPTQPSRESAPWSAWVAPPASLGIDTARILIAAILLERAPTTIRSLSFAREVRAWTQSRITQHAPKEPANETFPFAGDVSKKSDLPPGAEVSAGLPFILDHEPVPDAERVEPPGPSSPRSVAATGAPSRDSIFTASSSNVESRTDGPSLDLQSAPGTQKHSPKTRRNGKRAAPVPVEEEKPVSSIPAAASESIALPAALPDCISTEWAGSLYLVNVAIALRLYGDFVTPGQLGLALPLWDFLALLGGRMIGREFAEDPLNDLFARLAGRLEKEPAGAQFEPPEGETLELWLERICYDVGKQVTKSLGLGDDCDLRTLLLNHHAKIETTAERLDAHFSLAKHPIELRQAGLDRDPGWVPAGGRGIYFHYD